MEEEFFDNLVCSIVVFVLIVSELLDKLEVYVVIFVYVGLKLCWEMEWLCVIGYIIIFIVGFG